MIKVNMIMTAKWVVKKLGMLLVDNQPEDIKITIGNTQSNSDCAHINYYFAFGNFKNKSNCLDVSFFTHPDNDNFVKVAKKVDHCVVMCEKYKKLLVENNVDRGKISLIYPGISEIYRPKLKILQPVKMESGNRNHRKGLELWNKIAELPFVECTCTNGQYSLEEMYSLFKSTDIVLSTSLLEGGPMGVIEALSCGCCVVAPSGVGFVDDFDGIIKYSCGCYEEIYNILLEKYNRKLKIYSSVSNLTEKNWCDNHYALFRKLLENK